MVDSRTFIKLADDFDENLKIVGLSDAAFRLFVSGLCYCARNLTDGRIPKPAANRLLGKGINGAAKALLAAGLWENHGDAYVVHDYLEHQRSRAQIEEERRSSRERQRRHRAKSRPASHVTDDEVRMPDVDTDSDEAPPTPPQVGGRTKSLRSNSNNPRAVAARKQREKLELELRECSICGDASWNCTHCARKLRELEAV